MRKLLFLLVFLCSNALSIAQQGLIFKRQYISHNGVELTEKVNDEFVQISRDGGFVAFDNMGVYRITEIINPNQLLTLSPKGEEMMIELHKGRIVIYDTYEGEEILVLYYKEHKFKETP